MERPCSRQTSPGNTPSYSLSCCHNSPGWGLKQQTLLSQSGGWEAATRVSVWQGWGPCSRPAQPPLLCPRVRRALSASAHRSTSPAGELAPSTQVLATLPKTSPLGLRLPREKLWGGQDFIHGTEKHGPSLPACADQPMDINLGVQWAWVCPQPRVLGCRAHLGRNVTAHQGRTSCPGKCRQLRWQDCMCWRETPHLQAGQGALAGQAGHGASDV